MLITVNCFYGNLFYIVRSAKLACNLEHLSEFKMAVSAILNFGKCSTFDLDDIESRVLPRVRGFPGQGVISGVIFWIWG